MRTESIRGERVRDNKEERITYKRVTFDYGIKIKNSILCPDIIRRKKMLNGCK